MEIKGSWSAKADLSSYEAENNTDMFVGFNNPNVKIYRANPNTYSYDYFNKIRVSTSRVSTNVHIN